VIKAVSDLRQIGGFLRFHPPTEILLKVALNTIKQTNKQKTILFLIERCIIYFPKGAKISGIIVLDFINL
jgi:hypothetical protein